MGVEKRDGHPRFSRACHGAHMPPGGMSADLKKGTAPHAEPRHESRVSECRGGARKLPGGDGLEPDVERTEAEDGSAADHNHGSWDGLQKIARRRWRRRRRRRCWRWRHG
jgi:hypothetical protein